MTILDSVMLLLGIVTAPFMLSFTVYQCAKLASYGWRQGEHLFNLQFQKKENDNG